jgi:hypothetical protein
VLTGLGVAGTIAGCLQKWRCDGEELEQMAAGRRKKKKQAMGGHLARDDH